MALTDNPVMRQVAPLQEWVLLFELLRCLLQVFRVGLYLKRR
jgi:hypothetical protein